jgi:hypothetical protein
MPAGPLDLARNRRRAQVGELDDAVVPHVVHLLTEQAAECVARPHNEPRDDGLQRQVDVS